MHARLLDSTSTVHRRRLRQVRRMRDVGVRAGLVVLALALGKGAFGQTTPRVGFPISTDRPSFSDGPLIIPVGRINLETGYTYFEAAGVRTQTLPETLLRVPLSTKFELRVVNLGFGAINGQGNDLSGLLDPQIGFKYKLQDGIAGRRPDLAFIAVTTAPIGGRDFRVNTSQPTAKIAWYQQVTAVDGFGGNVNASLLGPDRDFTQFAVSVYWSRTLTSKLASFVEYYRLMPSLKGGSDADFTDAGLTYLLTPALQLDVRVGTGFNRSRDGAFIGAGVSYRF